MFSINLIMHLFCTLKHHFQFYFKFIQNHSVIKYHFNHIAKFSQVTQFQNLPVLFFSQVFNCFLNILRHHFNTQFN